MKKRDIVLDTPEVFVPLIEPGKRYRGAYGGRASGKSHFFAERLVEEALSSPGERAGEGLRAVCVREVQRTLSASSKLLIEDKIRRLGLGARFKIYEDRIKAPGDGLLIFQGMQNHTAESVKSLEGFRVAWIDEAQAISERSLNLLRPTIQRVAGAEIWASWNPRRPTDAIDVLLRGDEQPTGSVVVRANWRDNPFRTPETDQERADCLRIDPDSYPHIWEGEYATAHKGAYFTRELSALRADGRLCAVPVDPLMTVHLFWDIGGSGTTSDACSIWAMQRVGRTIGVIDYYEAAGQPLAEHVGWLHSRGYKPGSNVQLWLPHDGVQHDKVFQVTYQSELEKTGYDVTVVKNQGPGAAMARVQAIRRLLPQCAIDPRCMPGVEALGWYHERRDETRNCGLGPEHDWSSHAADSFGLASIVMLDALATGTPSGIPARRPARQAASWRA